MAYKPSRMPLHSCDIFRRENKYRTTSKIVRVSIRMVPSKKTSHIRTHLRKYDTRYGEPFMHGRKSVVLKREAEIDCKNWKYD
ncbi:MAG: hypothetical protein PHG66_01945 [Candidatus Colwellbacteria bacterium]|nr:hypothetical protein [Candidatus Colwellbacteria bacterium]